MLCQHCNNNEATSHIKRSINGQREEMHLCSECANELGVMEEFRMPAMSDLFDGSFLGNFLGAGIASMNSLAGVERCATCGSSFNDIVKSGHIGCSDCYDKFADKLEASIQKIHGKAKHLGKLVTYTEEEGEVKAPEKKSKAPKPDTLEELKDKLNKAIDEQRFEDAAVLRDKIKAMTEDGNE